MQGCGWQCMYIPSLKLLAVSWVSLAFITLSFVSGENRSGKDGKLELPYFSSCFCRPLDTSQFVQLVRSNQLLIPTISKKPYQLIFFHFPTMKDISGKTFFSATVVQEVVMTSKIMHSVNTTTHSM